MTASQPNRPVEASKKASLLMHMFNCFDAEKNPIIFRDGVIIDSFNLTLKAWKIICE